MALIEFTQPWRVRLWPFILVVLVVITFLIILLSIEAAEQLFYWWSRLTGATEQSARAVSTVSGNAPKGATIAAAVLALGAFIVGYHQWRAARRETSMDKFYERLKTANDRLAELKADKFEMYVYAELDNLEYVIEKYRLGYMGPDQALRGLETFRSRLEGDRGAAFAGKVKQVLGKVGYSTSTQNIVRQIILRKTAPTKSYWEDSLSLL